MILTDKALADFISSLPTEYKYENSERGVFLWLGNEINLLDKKYAKLLNALIIDWFDNHTEININLVLLLTIDEMKCHDALIKSIKKANKVYNKKINNYVK